MSKCRIKVIYLILIVLLQFGAIVNLAACPTDEQSLANAQEVWEQAIASLGGRESILSVKNILIYNKKLTSVSFKVLPDKLWYWKVDRKPIGTSITLYNFSTNIGYSVQADWDRNPFPLTGDSKERRLSGLLYTLLETKWIKPKLIGSDIIKIGGKDYDVVCTEVTFPDNQTIDRQITERHDYLFDRTTHLLFRNIEYFEKSIGGGDYTIEYSNYTDVKGIKFATQVRDKFSFARQWNNKTEYTTDINVDYKEDLFDKAPSIKDGADGWKTK